MLYIFFYSIKEHFSDKCAEPIIAQPRITHSIFSDFNALSRSNVSIEPQCVSVPYHHELNKQLRNTIVGHD